MCVTYVYYSGANAFVPGRVFSLLLLPELSLAYLGAQASLCRRISDDVV